MVVAEIPLWITHGSDAGNRGKAAAASSLDPNHKNSKNGTAAGGVGASSAAATATTALASLGLWRKDRAAIYAVDVHSSQPLMCTGGGDGTVRLWSTHSLFKEQHQGGRFENTTSKKTGNIGDDDDKLNAAAATTTTATGYVSTSSGSDNQSSADEGGDDDKMSTSNGSVGSSSVKEGDANNTTGGAVIHDLSSVVRSRKHPDAASSPERVAATSNNISDNNAADTAADPPLSAQSSANKGVHHHQRLLCTLSAHTGSSVLAVRFSSTGKLLASAGDDGCVCLYAPADTSNPATSMWNRILLCRGHNLDAVGLAWSPDDSYLVSCSLDRETPILVWKVGDVLDGKPPSSSMIRQAYKILGRNEHQSTVKGVCFDPVGSYIATSGDDPAVCIWRTHGDWGLERKIDAKDGIFRQWGADQNSVSLSSQSLFRRLSWSTDGAHICSTNSVVKNKNVASTISREQWAAAGAANLVGHKQPVVVAKHAPVLLAVPGEEHADDPDEEPAYATLLALGDKRGFVTIWSTRKSRPLFKLQCSESRCTVTDMSWGILPGGHLLLAVALLDGHMVALKLGVPDEMGQLLKPADQAKLFRLRYGIDTNDPASYGRLLMDDERPKLIETALQMTLEEDAGEEEDDNDGMQDNDDQVPEPPAMNQLVVRSKKDGKKRVQPFLMTQKAATAPSSPPAKRPKPSKPVTDPLENAKQIAAKAAAAAKAASTATDKAKASAGAPRSPPAVPPAAPEPPPPVTAVVGTHAATVTPIPYSTERLYSVDLAIKEGLLAEKEARWSAEGNNRPRQVPLGSKGPGFPCIDVSLHKDSKAVWHDQIVGTSCCAMAGSEKLFAVGTTDGTIQLYASSPLTGWRSETAVRAFPPIILGHPIVSLNIKQIDGSSSILVLLADGSFGVYRLDPTLAKVFGGSVLPAMTHMANATLHEEKNLPKLSRCQLTDKGQIILLLSSSTSSTSGPSSTPHGDQRSRAGHGQYDSSGSTIGGSVQGFVYHRELELWLRISDSRFVLSDFYSTLPLRRSQEQGPLRQLDDAVRWGAQESALKPSHRKRQDTSSGAVMLANAGADGGNFVPTKAHCEDRLACAVALGSSVEFRQWLGLYAKTLAMSGQESLLRTLVDVLLSSSDGGGWWLSSGLNTMGLDRTELLKKVVLPAAAKNRSLQRLTNELAMELDA